MKTTKKSAETLAARQNRVKRRYISAAVLVLVSVALACPALAAGGGGGGDPLSIVNNLSDFIFSIIKALGVIILFCYDTIPPGGENMTGPNEKRKQSYIPCPICGEKTDVKVYEDTVLVNFPLYCPKCGREVLVDVFDLKMVKSK